MPFQHNWPTEGGGATRRRGAPDPAIFQSHRTFADVEDEPKKAAPGIEKKIPPREEPRKHLKKKKERDGGETETKPKPKTKTNGAKPKQEQPKPNTAAQLYARQATAVLNKVKGDVRGTGLRNGGGEAWWDEGDYYEEDESPVGNEQAEDSWQDGRDGNAAWEAGAQDEDNAWGSGGDGGAGQAGQNADGWDADEDGDWYGEENKRPAPAPSSSRGWCFGCFGGAGGKKRRRNTTNYDNYSYEDKNQRPPGSPEGDAVWNAGRDFVEEEDVAGWMVDWDGVD